MQSPFPRALSALALATLLGLSGGALAQPIEVDLSPEQPDRVRAEPVQAAIDLIPDGYKFVNEGKLTVASVPGNLPFAVYGSDTRTPIGSEPDIAQLVADSLGLELELIPVAWADWPLGIQSGRFDAVIHNVTVTEKRKETLDFSTYRQDLIGFFVRNESDIQNISEAADLAGLKASVSSGTNQEEILVRWSEANVAAGLQPIDIIYYDDDAVRQLALESGRIDAYLGPNATSSFLAARDGKTRNVGTLSGGWPQTAEIAVATKKGSGLAEPISAAINAQIDNGNYAKTLTRWGLSGEAVERSLVNPPGLPAK